MVQIAVAASVRTTIRTAVKAHLHDAVLGMIEEISGVMEQKKTTMKNKNPFASWGIAVLLATLTACDSGDEVTSTVVPSDDEVCPRHLTITDVSVVGNTRAVINDEGITLGAAWSSGDKAAYCNLSRLDVDEGMGKPQPTQGNVTAISEGQISQFDGKVTCGNNNWLALVYPSVEYSFGSINGKSAAKFILSLNGQDGTLETLAKNYHYVIGIAPASVTDGIASAKMTSMKSLLTICKFSFDDRMSGDALTIKKLTICYANDGSGFGAGTYPTKATVLTGINTVLAPLDNVSLNLELDNANSMLVVSPSDPTSAVYVAMMPTANRSFTFTVECSDGATYSGTFKATLNEGEYVRATGLKLTSQTAAQAAPKL